MNGQRDCQGDVEIDEEEGCPKNRDVPEAQQSSTPVLRPCRVRNRYDTESHWIRPAYSVSRGTKVRRAQKTSNFRLANEAVHEAGHAVMARYLGFGLQRIWINGAEQTGRACVRLPHTKSQKAELLILAGARICMQGFGIDTRFDQGGLADEARIRTILGEMFPDEDDEATLCRHVDSLDAEVEEIFNRQDVRAAATILAEVLTRAREIDGPRAEAIIDIHLVPGKAKTELSDPGKDGPKLVASAVAEFRANNEYWAKEVAACYVSFGDLPQGYFWSPDKELFQLLLEIRALAWKMTQLRSKLDQATRTLAASGPGDPVEQDDWNAHANECFGYCNRAMPHYESRLQHLADVTPLTFHGLAAKAALIRNEYLADSGNRTAASKVVDSVFRDIANIMGEHG